MNIKVAVPASESVVLIRPFVTSQFLGIRQGLVFATSSNSDDEKYKCTNAAKKISDKADGHVSINVCEISLARSSFTIKLLGHEGNDLTYNEFKYPKAFASGKDSLLFIAEIQLLQKEVDPVEESLMDKNWQVTAIHNHELHEDPFTIFFHAPKSDNLDQRSQDIREVLNYHDTNCDCIS